MTFMDVAINPIDLIEPGDPITCYRPGDTALAMGRTYHVSEVFPVNETITVRELPGRCFWFRRFLSDPVDDDVRW